MAKKKKEIIKVTDFDFVSHGFMPEHDFLGCDITETNFSKSVSGSGLNEKEAFEDVLLQLSIQEKISEIDTSDIEKEARDLSEEYHDDPLEYDSYDDDDNGGFQPQELSSGDTWFYFSIRYNLPNVE